MQANSEVLWERPYQQLSEMGVFTANVRGPTLVLQHNFKIEKKKVKPSCFTELQAGVKRCKKGIGTPQLIL